MKRAIQRQLQYWIYLEITVNNADAAFTKHGQDNLISFRDNPTLPAKIRVLASEPTPFGVRNILVWIQAIILTNPGFAMSANIATGRLSCR